MVIDYTRERLVREIENSKTREERECNEAIVGLYDKGLVSIKYIGDELIVKLKQ